MKARGIHALILATLLMPSLFSANGAGRLSGANPAEPSHTYIVVLVEQPAHIQIESTENIAPNAPYVDSEQLFQIAVIVENSGQDAARDITISLATDSLSTIVNSVDTLKLVHGGQSDTLKFNVQAYYGWII